jgi:hypothetical protein
MVIGMGSGVIPTSSCSSWLDYTTDFNGHEDCRRKQQKIYRELEETQISLRETQISLRETQILLRDMQEKIDMLTALVRRLENFSDIIYFFTHIN